MSHTSTSSTARRQASSLNQEEDTIDPREIDQVVIEMSGMTGRWSLFRKFLIDSFEEHEEHPAKVDTVLEDAPELPLDSTTSQQAFDDMLVKYYIPLEVWYVRTIIDKVLNLTAKVS